MNAPRTSECCGACGDALGEAGVVGIVTHPRIREPIAYSLCDPCSAEIRSGDRVRRTAVAMAVEARLGIESGAPA